MRIKANSPHSWPQELNKKQRSIIESKDSSMAARWVELAVRELLVGIAVRDRLGLLYARALAINLILEEVVGLLEDEVIPKFGS